MLPEIPIVLVALVASDLAIIALLFHATFFTVEQRLSRNGPVS